MKSIAEIMRSQARYDSLGGRTIAENAEHWKGQWAQGLGHIWPKGPGTADAVKEHQVLPEDTDLAWHLNRCGVPDRLAAIIVAGPEQTAPVLAARKWIEGDDSFLLLHGKTDGGKSLAASTVFLAAREVVRWEGGEQAKWASFECGFASVVDLASQSYYGEEGRELVAHLKRVRLLVLDDLGNEVLAAPYLSTLEEVLNHRFGNRSKRTVLTSNVSARRTTADEVSPFEARYGARIARRIRESGTVLHVEPRGAEVSP